MTKKSISRRDFLKGAAASTLGLAAVGMLGGCSSEDAPKASASTISWTKETDVLIVGAGGHRMAGQHLRLKMDERLRSLPRSLCKGRRPG